MKKALYLTLVVFILMASLPGCSNQANEISKEIGTVSFDDPIESYDEESRFFVEGESSDLSFETSQSPSNSDFLVRQKKYEYFEKDVIILEVSNETENNYSVTITGNYIDSNGGIIATEEQTTIGFSSGFKKYYIFMPNMVFDSFSYELSVEKYHGECHEANIFSSFHPAKLEKGWAIDSNGNTIGYHQMYPIINCDVAFENKNDEDVFLVGTLIVFDNTGNLHCIWPLGLEGVGSNDSGGQTVPIYYEITDKEIDFPANLTGELKMIFTIDAIFTDYREADSWLYDEGATLQQYRRQYGTPGKKS